MIPLWKGKNPIYFGVITIIPFDNLYRRAYFVMHTFLVEYLVIYKAKVHDDLEVFLCERQKMIPRFEEKINNTNMWQKSIVKTNQVMLTNTENV